MLLMHLTQSDWVYVMDTDFVDHPRNGMVCNFGCVCLSVCRSVRQ